MKHTSAMLVALALVLVAHSAHAQAGFQLGLPNTQIPQNPDVSGVRLSFLHGKNRSQRGLDLGLFSVSETTNLSGLALIGGMSRVTGNMAGGAAISLVNWHDGRDSGLNAAFINLLHDTEEAFNVGFVNIVDRGAAFDLGGVNVSRNSTAQLGFVNVTDRIDGVQFGFLNLAKNGFLPIFPFFNFPKN